MCGFYLSLFSDLFAMEAIGVVGSGRVHLTSVAVQSTVLPGVHHTPQPSSNSTPKFGHQRNLSLDFRSMGIILPPLSATIQSHKYVHLATSLQLSLVSLLNSASHQCGYNFILAYNTNRYFSSRSRHQRNRSLDSVLQKIPESESDGGTIATPGDVIGHHLHHQPHHGSVDQAKLPHHPPLKPCLSLSLDPCSNLFARFKDGRR